MADTTTLSPTTVTAAPNPPPREVDVNITINRKLAKQLKVPVSAKNPLKTARTQPSPEIAPPMHISYTPQAVAV